MFKICVVGCGGMSTGGHGPSFRKYAQDYKDVVLAACCDLDEEKAKKYANSFGFQKWYTDYEQMLAECKPDVVSLISPVKLTKSLSIALMKLGYHVIMEKPPGLDSGEIMEMIAQAEESKVSVRTCFNRRYTPLIRKLKELLAGKQIYNITYQMYRYNRRDDDFATTAIHAIDVVKDIVGADYESVNFHYQEMPHVNPTAANFYLDCAFENGAVGQITMVPMGGVVIERITVNVEGESFFVELPFWENLDAPGRLTHMRNGQLVQEISGDSLVDSTAMFEESGFYEENRDFFEYLRRGEPIHCDLYSGIQSVDIANALRQRAARYVKE